MEAINEFTRKYNIFEHDEVQKVQLAHRLSLCNVFGITKGMRILEIGCGQGDTTAILGHLVGDEGHVDAIDIAASSYGAPQTLGEAHEKIKQTALGKRINFFLETDFLQFESAEMYDAVVLSHSSWYFYYENTLSEYFKKMKQIAKTVYFAEWDLNYKSLSQRAHFNAVTLQALYSAYIKNDGNIQRVWSQSHIVKLAEQAGWKCKRQEIVDASYLQDGEWEVAFANYIRPHFLKLPAALQTLANGYYDVMNSEDTVKSLNSFVLVFE